MPRRPSSSNRARSRQRPRVLTWVGAGAGGVAVLAFVVALVVNVGAALQRPTYSSEEIAAVNERIAEDFANRPDDRVEPTVAAFIGDSYTAAAGSTETGGFATLLSAAQGWREVNLGKGGTGYINSGQPQDSEGARLACGFDYCPSYPEVIADAAAANPAVVIVSGGRNNVEADLATTTEHINRFYADLRAALPETRIIVTSPIWDDDPAPALLAQISDAVRAASAAVGAEYLDIGEPLAGRPDLLASDGVHPNDDGYRAIADAIAAQLGS